MGDDSTKLLLDGSAEGALKAVQAVLNAINLLQGRVEQADKAFVKFDRDLNVIGATFQKQVSSTEKLSETFVQTKNGLESVGIAYTKMADKAEQAAKRETEARKKASDALRRVGRDVNRTTFLTANDSEKANFEAAEESVRHYAATYGIAGKEILKNAKQVAQGRLDAENHVTAVLKQKLFDLKQASDNLGTARAKQNKKIIEEGDKFVRQASIQAEKRSRELDAEQAKTKRQGDAFVRQAHLQAEKRLNDLRKEASDEIHELERLRIAREKAARVIQRTGPINPSIAAQVSDVITSHPSAPHNSSFSTASEAERIRVDKSVSQLQRLLQVHVRTDAQIATLWNQIQSGMASKALETDQVIAKSLIGVHQSYRAIGTEAEKLNEKTNGFHVSWRSLLRAGIFTLVYRAMHSVVNQIEQGIQRSDEFMKRLTEISTIDLSLHVHLEGVTDIAERAKIVSQSFEAWNTELKKLSKSFGFDILDEAEAAYQALSNQVVNNTGEFRIFGEAANKFALTGVLSVTNAVELLTGVMKSYHLGVTEAENVSAALFETIVLGRVRGEELAKSFGQLTVLAANLGITYQELGAAVATTTVQGIKFDEAATQIRGVMTSLLKPTAEMRKFFQEINVESGQAAISAFGFTGVLERMRNFAGADSEEMRKLIDKMRGFTGAITLTQTSFGLYLDNLSQVSNALGTYRTASDIAIESTRTTVQGALKEISNEFNDLGVTILNNLAAFIQWEGGVAGVIKVTESLILGSIAGVAGYVFASFTINLLKTIKTLTATKLVFDEVTGAIRAMTLAEKALESTSLAGIIAIGVGAVVAGIALIVESLPKANEKLHDFFKTWRTDAEEIAAIQNGINEKLVRDYIDTVNAHTHQLERDLTHVFAYNQKYLESMKQTATQIDLEYRELSKAFNKHISEITKELNKAKEEGTKAADAIARLQEHKDELKFKIRFEDDTGNLDAQIKDAKDALELIQNRKVVLNTTNTDRPLATVKDIEKLQADEERIIEVIHRKEVQAAEKLAKKKQDLVDEAEKKAKSKEEQAQKLLVGTDDAHLKRINNRFNLEQELHRQKAKNLNDQAAAIRVAAKQEADAVQGVIDKINSQKTAQEDVVRGIQITENMLAELAQAEADIEKKKNIQLQQENAKKQVIAADIDILKRSENTLTKLNTIKDPQQLAAVLQQVLKARQELADLGVPLDVVNLAQTEKEQQDFADAIGNRIGQIARESTENAVRAATQQLEDMFAKINKTIDAMRQALIEGGQKLGSDADALLKVSEDFNKSRRFPTGLADNNIAIARQNAEVDKAQAALTKIGEAQKAFNQAIEASKNAPKPDIQDIDNKRKALDAAINEVKNNKDLLTLISGFVGGDKVTTILDHMQGLLDNKDFAGLPALWNDAQQKLDALAAANGPVVTQLQKTKQNIIDWTTEITNAKNAITDLTGVLEKLRHNPPVLLIDPNKNVNIAPGLGPAPPHPHLGGRIRRMMTGGSIGTDTVPAMLTPGEFVVNADSTRAFYSQLLHINSPNRLRDFTTNGKSNDAISITVNESSSPQQTAIEVAKELRRQKRRGRI